MNGYKTKIAGVGGILAGLAVIAKALSGDAAVEFDHVWEGAVMVVGGLGLLGIGGKLQKLIDAIGAPQK